MAVVRVLVSLAAVLLLGAVVPPARAAFVNFESGHVRPLALSPGGELLFAVNTQDNRLAVYTVSGGSPGLTLVAEVPVGLEPVAVATRSAGGSIVQAFVANHLSDSVSVVEVDLNDPAGARVRRTLLVGDEPRDIVIDGSGGHRVFVTTAHRGQNRPGTPQLTTEGVGRADVWVFDADDLGSTLGGTPIGGAPIVLFGDTPRALARSADGSRVYVAVFQSGNQTTTINAGAAHSGGPPPYPPPPAGSTANPPEVGLIVKFDPVSGQWRDELSQSWSAFVPFTLPDQDVFVLNANATPPSQTGVVTGVGTTLFNMAVRPGAAPDRLYVSNTEARNHVRFEPVLSGHLVESRITVVAGGTANPRHLNPHIDFDVPTGPPSEIAQSLAFPTDMVFSSDGLTLYVAALGSGKVGVFDAPSLEAGSLVQNQIAVGAGPSGLALDEAHDRLYVMNRFDHDISVVSDVSNPALRAETARVSLRYNPEPAAITAGRPFLYDAAFTSGHGDNACASCHVFADKDELAWDLGDSTPGAPIEQNFNPFQSPFIPPVRVFHPLKGPMTTQSLRGMDGMGPMHWRGDRTGATSGNPNGAFDEPTNFGKFNPAFVSLLGRATPLTAEEMGKFTSFILTVVYPPSPLKPLTNAFTPGSPEALGQAFFSGTAVDGGQPCATCHDLPFGTDGRSTFEGESQEFKVAHLRNLYTKVGMFGVPTATPGIPATGDLGDQVRGFGFLHDGSIATVFDFLQADVFNFAGGSTGNTQRRNLEAFAMAFDTGLAPAVGQQVTIDATTFSQTAFTDRISLLIARDDAGDCDLVVKGIVAGIPRGAVYVGSGSFQTDRVADGLLTATQVRQLAATPGQEITYTCVPPGNGTRIGIDRDEDGFRDRDELDQGSDPADPNSVPGSTTTTSTSSTSTSSSSSSTSTSSSSTSTSVSTTSTSTSTSSTSSSTTTSTSTTTSSSIPPAAAVLVQTTSFTMQEGSLPPGTRKYSFKSSTKRDPLPNRVSPPAFDSTGDPSLHGATLRIYNASGSGETVTVVVPGGPGWKRTGAGGYAYKNPDTNGAVRKLQIKRDLLKVSGGGASWGYSLDEPTQGQVAVRVTAGSGPTWCAVAGTPPFVPRRDEPGRYQAASKTPPPAACP